MSDNKDLVFYGSGKIFTNQDGTLGTVYLEVDVEEILKLIKNPTEGGIKEFTNKDGKLIKKLKLKANPTKADVSKLYIIAQQPPKNNNFSSGGNSNSESGNKDLPF